MHSKSDRQFWLMQGQIHGLMAVIGAAIELLPRSRIPTLSRELARAYETAAAALLASEDPSADLQREGLDQVRDTLTQALDIRASSARRQRSKRAA